jgi:tripartite-type tricarboxylate transporter receptor subunit TctC
MTTVPYKGTAPAMTDLLGGQVDIMCDQTTNTTSQIEAGKVKAYAVTPQAPDDAGAGQAAHAGRGRA